MRSKPHRTVPPAYISAPRHRLTRDKFRLLNPEASAFLYASCNPDKQLQSSARENGEQAHIPYLKAFNDSFHLSVKGVWCFEAVTRNVAFPVQYNSPLRVRHVPSGKCTWFLSAAWIRCYFCFAPFTLRPVCGHGRSFGGHNKAKRE